MAKRVKSATERLRNLVANQIRRMESSGYRVSESLKEKIKSGKYQTLKSLQKGKYKKVYESSTGEVDGKIVSGAEKQAYERKESARKAVETRRRKAKERGEDWESQRRKQDEIDKSNAEAFNEGSIRYDNIIAMIDKYPTKGSKYLNDLLKSEISRYGLNNVLIALGQVDEDIVKVAQDIIYYNYSADVMHSALFMFSQIIRGSIPTEDEAKEIGEVLDDIADYDEY